MREIDTVTDEFSWINIDMVFLRGAPKSRDVNHPRYPLERTTDFPVLYRLDIRQTRTWTTQFIPIDFGDGPPGRKHGLHALRQLDCAEAIQDFLAIPKEVAVEVEIYLDITEPEDRERTDIRETGSSTQRHLDRNRNLSFDFLSRIAGELGDQLDHWGRWIGIGHDVEQMKGVETADEEQEPKCTDQESLNKRQLNDFRDHRSSSTTRLVQQWRRQEESVIALVPLGP